MRLSQWALCTALLAVLAPSAALAQQPYPMLPSSGVQRTAYEYRDYYAQDPALRDEEGGGHVTTRAEDEAYQAQSGGLAAAAAGNGSGDNGCGNGCGEEEAEGPCRLFECEWLESRNITIAGWVAQSPFTWNPQNPDNRFNGIVTWTDRSNEYQLNQLYWYAEKTTDTESYGSDIGGRVDLMYGTDTRFTQALGLEDKWNLGQRFYGLALPQLYMEAAFGDTKTKLGHFYCPSGYEVVPTVNNFFNTLPLTFQYGEPFTLTGLLTTYAASDNLSLGGGFVRGWDTWDGSNPASSPNLAPIGAVTATGEGGDSLAFFVIESQELNQNGQFTHRHLNTFAYSVPLNNEWTYVAQHDLGYQNAAMANGKSAWWYGFNNYLFYKVSDTWTWGVRAEWFRDQDGFRVGGFLPTLANGSTRGLPTTFSGYAGNFTELTFGANWKPTANFVARPCIRWDTYAGEDNNAGGLRPFDDGNKNWQILVGGDIILLY
ncbi:MAG: porin [Pirellulales bacterium]|nr:porin [Pirellulales bacterium]